MRWSNCEAQAFGEAYDGASLLLGRTLEEELKLFYALPI